MRAVITGAGQIGSQLAQDLIAAGHEVTLVRRSAAISNQAIRTVVADVGDVQAWAEAAKGADAIFHCIHAPYDARAWERELVHREQAVLSVAAQHGIPVIFPESMYAFGTQTRSLHEGAPLAPTTPLARVRADLLRARAEHPVRTLSVVASDLIGPTAGDGSVATVTVFRRLASGRRAFLLGDPDMPHSWTFIPDLTTAMRFCAEHSEQLAPTGDAVLHCPTGQPRTLRELANDAARILGARPRVLGIPRWPLRVGRWLHPMVRELDNQQHLWREPCVLHTGRLITVDGLAPTPWEEALRASVSA